MGNKLKKLIAVELLIIAGLLFSMFVSHKTVVMTPNAPVLANGSAPAPPCPPVCWDANTKTLTVTLK